MSSLVERLRVRSDRKPVYNIDDWDDGEDLDLKRPGSGLDQQKIERIVRDDAVCSSRVVFCCCFLDLVFGFCQFPLGCDVCNWVVKLFDFCFFERQRKFSLIMKIKR